jgi:hypothetical protein
VERQFKQQPYILDKKWALWAWRIEESWIALFIAACRVRLEVTHCKPGSPLLEKRDGSPFFLGDAGVGRAAVDLIGNLCRASL